MAKSKRGQGEWSFSQRKDKLWTARRQFGKKENGKPNIVAFYGKSITEVRRKAKEYEEKLTSQLLPAKLSLKIMCEIGLIP